MPSLVASRSDPNESSPPTSSHPSPSSASSSSPSSSMVFFCRWSWCRSTFSSRPKLVQHLDSVHIKRAKRIKIRDLRVVRETEEAGNGMGKSNTRAQAMWKGYEREFDESTQPREQPVESLEHSSLGVDDSDSTGRSFLPGSGSGLGSGFESLEKKKSQNFRASAATCIATYGTLREDGRSTHASASRSHSSSAHHPAKKLSVGSESTVHSQSDYSAAPSPSSPARSTQSTQSKSLFFPETMNTLRRQEQEEMINLSLYTLSSIPSQSQSQSQPQPQPQEQSRSRSNLNSTSTPTTVSSPLGSIHAPPVPMTSPFSTSGSPAVSRTPQAQVQTQAQAQAQADKRMALERSSRRAVQFGFGFRFGAVKRGGSGGSGSSSGEVR